MRQPSNVEGALSRLKHNDLYDLYAYARLYPHLIFAVQPVHSIYVYRTVNDPKAALGTCKELVRKTSMKAIKSGL